MRELYDLGVNPPLGDGIGLQIYVEAEGPPPVGKLKGSGSVHWPRAGAPPRPYGGGLGHAGRYWRPGGGWVGDSRRGSRGHARRLEAVVHGGRRCGAEGISLCTPVSSQSVFMLAEAGGSRRLVCAGQFSVRLRL